MRALPTLAATSLLVVLTTAPAAAHVAFMPAELAPGTTIDAELALVHGCGPGGTVPQTEEAASPTSSVALEVPAGLVVTARELDGWELTTEVDDAGRTTSARWTARDEGGVPGAISFGVGVDAADLGDGTEVVLPVVQSCVDGAQLRWTLPTVEERDGRYPAPVVAVTSGAANAPAPTGPSPWLVGGLLVALAGSAGVASYALTDRRPS